MIPLNSLPLSTVPEFAVVVPDGARLNRYDLKAGDIILCDFNINEAHYVVASCEDEYHVCIQSTAGTLFDVTTGQALTDDAEAEGRIIGVVRLWTAQTKHA